MRFSFMSLLLLTSLLLNGCSTNAIGFVGSSMWLDTAPRQEIDDYMQKKSVVELSRVWNSAEFMNEREAVARELELRDLDPLMFYDPTADQIRSLNRRLDRIEEDTSRRSSITCSRYPSLLRC